ncbi:hypothetical protein F4805DRAFT_393234 [Annulohypoxylon moriforme]|nr:hypothetical protein F4805DRAFT_393234 [Annulohypoxylon moriforme]
MNLVYLLFPLSVLSIRAPSVPKIPSPKKPSPKKPGEEHPSETIELPNPTSMSFAPVFSSLFSSSNVEPTETWQSQEDETATHNTLPSETPESLFTTSLSFTTESPSYLTTEQASSTPSITWSLSSPTYSLNYTSTVVSTIEHTSTFRKPGFSTSKSQPTLTGSTPGPTPKPKRKCRRKSI